MVQTILNPCTVGRVAYNVIRLVMLEYTVIYTTAK